MVDDGEKHIPSMPPEELHPVFSHTSSRGSVGGVRLRRTDFRAERGERERVSLLGASPGSCRL